VWYRGNAQSGKQCALAPDPPLSFLRGTMRRRTILSFASAGVAGAVAAYALAFWKNYTHAPITSSTDSLVQVICLAVCPPSLGLMAADNAGLSAADFGNVADSGRKCWPIYFTWDGVSASLATTIVASIKIDVLTRYNGRWSAVTGDLRNGWYVESGT